MQNLGIKTKSLGLRTPSLGINIESLGLRIEKLGVTAESLGLRIERLHPPKKLNYSIILSRILSIINPAAPWGQAPLQIN